MGSCTHYRVLLRKNFITLRRNYGFAICFFLLPVMTMGIFSMLLSLVSDGDRVEQNNLDGKLAHISSFLYRSILYLHQAEL